MTPEKINITIAKACGWTQLPKDSDEVQYTARNPDGKWGMIPNYFVDLNAMHEAEARLDGYQLQKYGKNLQELVNFHCVGVVSDYPRQLMCLARVAGASAAQRSAAFLRVLGLWEDSSSANAQDDPREAGKMINDNTETEQRPAVVVHRPVRVVLSRRKGWRMPENTLKVCRPSKYGNPFHVADVLEHYDGNTVAAQADCVRSYIQWLADGVTSFCDDGPPSIGEIKRDLAGKNLACWCKKGTPCHADILIDLANA